MEAARGDDKRLCRRPQMTAPVSDKREQTKVKRLTAAAAEWVVNVGGGLRRSNYGPGKHKVKHNTLS